MKVAIPAWAGQVSTVFDFAHSLLLVELHSGKEVGRSEIPLDEYPSILRAGILSRLGVKVLICGAISRSLATVVAGYGIEIIPFVSGMVDEVLDAYLTGRLAEARFLLPGYPASPTTFSKRRRDFRGGHREAGRRSGISYDEARTRDNNGPQKIPDRDEIHLDTKGRLFNG
ncbi:MAG: NifB/NifX family molybdenum-iron cluster-binding protein [Desulfobacterales bacterium]|nr:NifB/NifX family molybdenum-iron cluster-binding protein [Desulfobacterales bacterium]